MKRISWVLLLSIAGLGAAQAGIIACTNTTVASLIALGGGAGNGCFVDDILFNDFSYSPLAGAPAADQLIAGLQSNAATMTYGWRFSSGTGAFTGDFSLGFTASVITAGPGACPACVITSVTEQMLGGVMPPDPVSISVAQSTGLSPIAINNLSFGNNTNGNSFAGVATLTKTATTSGISATNPLVSYESSVRQSLAHAPEPATLSLIGVSLLGLGLLRRSRTGRASRSK